MAAMNYSRQREAIKNYLMSTDIHPTADEVYTYVKCEFPNISLATVYRNLNLLVEIGEANRITTTAGKERFDGDVAPHDHVVCTCCGEVSDIHIPEKEVEKIHQIISRCYDGDIDKNKRLFYGICRSCKMKHM